MIYSDTPTNDEFYAATWIVIGDSINPLLICEYN